MDGAEVVNMVSDLVRAELLRRIGLGDVLTPRDFTGQFESRLALLLAVILVLQWFAAS
jgi:hypothetical protein